MKVDIQHLTWKTEKRKSKISKREYTVLIAYNKIPAPVFGLKFAPGRGYKSYGYWYTMEMGGSGWKHFSGKKRMMKEAMEKFKELVK